MCLSENQPMDRVRKRKMIFFTKLGDFIKFYIKLDGFKIYLLKRNDFNF